MSQPFQLKRTGDADYPRHLKILLQGPPKSGKTTFLATAPNIIVAAVEAGLMSIAHKDIPYVEVTDTSKLQTLQLVISDPSLRAQAAANLGLPSIDTVAIDTLDAYQEMLKREILAENRRTVMEQRDWGILKERLAAIMKAFVALPVNVIFTVHTSTSQDDEQRMIYAPALQGSIKDDVAGYVDFSLLAYRQREVDAQGAASIRYYLKNEGDLRNPTLGNRAAGRVPEICDPEFRVLYDAVFKGIDLAAPSQNPTEITGLPAPAASQPAVAQPPAQTPSQPEAPQVPATGVPTQDDDLPINASGISTLTKQYTERGLVVPEDLRSWNLGKARAVSRWFAAWNADRIAGQNPTRDQLIEYLQGLGAFAGELAGVQAGVGNVAAPPKPPVEPPAAPPPPGPAPTQQPEPEPTAPATESPAAPVSEVGSQAEGTESAEQDAVQLITEGLGAVPVIDENTPCDACGKPIDDIDIAQLARTRFRRTLCVDDYKNANKQR